LLAAGAVRADEDDASIYRKPRAWYGYETLLADAAFIGLFATVPAWQFDGRAGGVLLTFDAIGFASVAPILHSLNGNGDGGGIALALNVGLPFAGMWTGIGFASMLDCKGWLCGLTNMGWGAYAGILSGAGLAAIIDASVLAWKKPSHHDDHPCTTFALTPITLPSGAGLSVAGTF